MTSTCHQTTNTLVAHLLASVDAESISEVSHTPCYSLLSPSLLHSEFRWTASKSRTHLWHQKDFWSCWIFLYYCTESFHSAGGRCHFAPPPSCLKHSKCRCMPWLSLQTFLLFPFSRLQGQSILSQACGSCRFLSSWTVVAAGNQPLQSPSWRTSLSLIPTKFVEQCVLMSSFNSRNLASIRGSGTFPICTAGFGCRKNSVFQKIWCHLIIV